MNTTLFLSSVSFVIGGLLLVVQVLAGRREPLAVRLARVEGRIGELGAPGSTVQLPGWLVGLRASYERDLRRAGGGKTLRRFFADKALLAFAAPFVVLAPYAAATGRLPSLALVVLLAIAGSFVPDLLLRQQVKQRREAIFLDLPEMIAVLSLSLGAGQSLRQALELAGRDCAGPLGAELERALTLARKERGLSEREALVRVAREAGEPTFTRFCELLAVKESPYLDFLRQQAREARAEQARYLERAADRAYLSMHAPLAPLLAVLVLVLAYGFLRFLSHTV
jgi:Flp pilus assembly protein TadB